MGRKILKILISLAVFILLVAAVQRLVIPKYAEKPVEGRFTAEYYEETTPHDVIIIGDCEVYENIDPMYLWSRYGITSYIRGNAQQLTWQSYYMLKDTLQYETPKVVIYNVQALMHAAPMKEEYNRMTLDGMKWSEIKADAVKASMCENENFVEYLFPVLRYHKRILELTEEDFTYYFQKKKVTHNGYYMRLDVLPVSESDVADPSWLFDKKKEESDAMDSGIMDPWTSIEGGDEIAEESPVAGSGNTDPGEDFGEYPMEYLDRMRKLCKEKGIRLVLMKAPSLAPEWYDSYNEQMVKYADKYGLDYLNFYELIEETGLDFESDTYDGGLHMNLSGADKISEYLGAWLTQNCDIKNHGSERAICRVYEEKMKFYEQMKMKQKKEIQKYGKVVSY